MPAGRIEQAVSARDPNQRNPRILFRRGSGGPEDVVRQAAFLPAGFRAHEERARRHRELGAFAMARWCGRHAGERAEWTDYEAYIPAQPLPADPTEPLLMGGRDFFLVGHPEVRISVRPRHEPRNRVSAIVDRQLSDSWRQPRKPRPQGVAPCIHVHTFAARRTGDAQPVPGATDDEKATITGSRWPGGLQPWEHSRSFLAIPRMNSGHVQWGLTITVNPVEVRVGVTGKHGVSGSLRSVTKDARRCAAPIQRPQNSRWFHRGPERLIQIRRNRLRLLNQASQPRPKSSCYNLLPLRNGQLTSRI